MTTDLPSRIVWAFSRVGAEGEFTRLFDSLSEPERAGLTGMFAVREGETPVIASVRVGRMFVVTSQRVAAEGPDERWEMALSGLASVTDYPPWLVPPKRTRLRLEDRAGQAHLLEIEPGPPLKGVWRALRAVIAISQGGESAGS